MCIAVIKCVKCTGVVQCIRRVKMDGANDNEGDNLYKTYSLRGGSDMDWPSQNLGMTCKIPPMFDGKSSWLYMKNS